jgi:CRP/FNR family cyclic AMP-dependent transcriptional regulator
VRDILDHCAAVPLERLAEGTVLLREGEKTGRAYVLAEGRIEVLRGGARISILDEPGALIGETSILLNVPHTATARALGEVKVHVIRDAAAFFGAHPELGWILARLLANRLNAATSYLADLKRQFAGHGDHLEMVGEVLETLIHQQDQDFAPGSDRDPGGS